MFNKFWRAKKYIPKQCGNVKGSVKKCCRMLKVEWNGRVCKGWAGGGLQIYKKDELLTCRHTSTELWWVWWHVVLRLTRSHSCLKGWIMVKQCRIASTCSHITLNELNNRGSFAGSSPLGTSPKMKAAEVQFSEFCTSVCNFKSTYFHCSHVTTRRSFSSSQRNSQLLKY